MADPVVYATVAELQARWPDMPTGAESHALVLLEDASALLRASTDVSGADPHLLKIIVCEMVQKVMTAPDAGADVASLNMTAGPFSQQVTYRGSSDLFVSKKHLKMLGVGRQRAFSVDLIGDLDVP